MVLRPFKGAVCGVAGAVCRAAGVVAGGRPGGAPLGRPGGRPAIGPPVTVYPTETPGKAPKPTADELRKRYPFESLADRLKYEAAAKDAPAPKLAADAAKRLAGSEKWFEQGKLWDMRTRSLEKVHSA